MRIAPVYLAVLASLFVALSSSTVALAARAGPGPDPAAMLDAPQRQVALGISIVDGRDIGALNRFRTSIGGRTPATWSIWSQWGSPGTRAFPTAAASQAKARGSTPMVWWEPFDPTNHGSATYARLANISAGKHDDYIRRFARDARDFGSPVILRFAHEANGRIFPWGVGSFDNSASKFVAAWRHVHRLFREVGATNVRFLWSVSKKACGGVKGCNPYRAFYPGDAFVDLMGFSNFNWGAKRDEWVPMIKGFRRVTNDLASISSKPIIAAENACNPKGGDKAAWIRNGYRAVYEELPRIVGIVYLDVDLRFIGHPDWRLSSPAGALAAYREIAGLAQFQGRLPGT
jgi:Glycosyl hydrolase family 26